MNKVNVLKKNRKYFSVMVDGYKCKLLIDDSSDALELGEHNLALEDISVRTKYGTDVIYKLQASVDQQQNAGITTLIAEYNKVLVEKCRELGGKWDDGVWVFSGIVEYEVEELDELYNSEKNNNRSKCT